MIPSFKKIEQFNLIYKNDPNRYCHFGQIQFMSYSVLFPDDT